MNTHKTVPVEPAALLAAFDKAVADELPRVSHAEYDSHEICKHFASQVRARIESAPPSPVTETNWRLYSLLKRYVDQDIAADQLNGETTLQKSGLHRESVEALAAFNAKKGGLV